MTGSSQRPRRNDRSQESAVLENRSSYLAELSSSLRELRSNGQTRRHPSYMQVYLRCVFTQLDDVIFSSKVLEIECNILIQLGLVHPKSRSR